MGKDVAADGIGRVPDAVQVVAHDIDKINVVHGLEVEVPEIPVAGRDGERHGVLLGLLVVHVIQLLEEGDEVLAVIGLAATVPGAGILPVEINTVEAVLAHKAEKVADEELPVRARADHVAKDGLSGSVIVVEGPAAERYDGLQAGVALLDAGELVEERSGQVVHGGHLEVSGRDVGEAKICVGEGIHRDVAEPHAHARFLVIPGLVVANDPFLDVAVLVLGTGLLAIALATGLFVICHFAEICRRATKPEL